MNKINIKELLKREDITLQEFLNLVDEESIDKDLILSDKELEELVNTCEVIDEY